MGRTFIRQDAQIASTATAVKTFADNVAPTLAAYQTNPADLVDDLNNLRSAVNYARRPGFSQNWYTAQVAPSTLEAGSVRGVDDLNDALHLLEKKRFLRKDVQLVDVAVPATQNYVILGGGELPANTTIAVGAVTTLGTVAADHNAAFGAHSLLEVAGPTAISPDNLVNVVDGSSRDPILSSGRTVYALLQSENASDGFTATGTTPNRLQVSFVRINATGDDLEACPVADIENQTVNLCFRARARFEDFLESDLLNDAKVDVPAGSTPTRQSIYNNQGTTPVDQSTNATLDLEAAGIYWELRDDLEARLFAVIEGSAGGTSTVEVAAAVDVLDINAVTVDVASGMTVRSGGGRPIQVGVNDGIIETTAGALELQATTTLSLDDGNKPVGWSLAEGIHLSDAAQEWTDFETNFGEVSILNAINQAYGEQVRTKVQAVLTANVTATNDVNGPGTPHNNTDVDLPPYDAVPTSFVQNVEVYLNGELLRNDAAAAGSNDVYPGGTPADGDLAFNFDLKGTGAKPDQLTVIVNGQ